ncbi:MAG: sugar phosphorylase [Lachnospiraceae bacterium]|nr:sugar phosphorylase [Lachnospiraceae bacterium]
MTWEEKIYTRLRRLYQTDEKADEALKKIRERLDKYEAPEKCADSPQTADGLLEIEGRCPSLTQKDTMLITYGDTLRAEGEPGLKTLIRFLDRYVGHAIEHVHLLPMYPYTSDDGFSVVDYRKINPALGSWDEIRELSRGYGMMFDAVINHVSRSSEWFRLFAEQKKPYTDYFIVCDPDDDYSQVARPRALPLLTKVDTADGEKYVWTTFSTDQIDLNFHSPDVLAEILDILVFFGRSGATFIRLDAIGYSWKKKGTSCLNLPEAHELVRLIHDVLTEYSPGTSLITETNVPQEENLAYFGDGTDEAQLVYQFPLPPLTMYTLITGDSSVMTRWLKEQKTPSEQTAFFNFLSSHDGIGLRPTEGILTPEQRELLVETTLRNGGQVSYKDNGDGTKSPYELNINYQDALAGPEDSDEVRIGRFLAAETLLISLQGMPGIYIHSLLGSRNDYLGAAVSGIPRRINRAQLELAQVEEWLSDQSSNRSRIFYELIRRLNIRRELQAFSPQEKQQVLEAGSSLIAFTRSQGDNQILVLINVTGQEATFEDPVIRGRDLLCEDTQVMPGRITLRPYQAAWLSGKEQ